MPSFIRRVVPFLGKTNNSSDSIIESEDNVSRHSSVQSIEHDEGHDTSFPVYSASETASSTPKIYARSLLSTGNGFGLNRVIGNIARPKEHLQQGALLGDVGFMDPASGNFVFRFNIFFPSTHPIQPKQLPVDFTPFSSLSDLAVSTTPNYFPPGSVITSNGITISQQSITPLKVEFTMTSPEGAVLILPTGALREDLCDPSAIHPYLKSQAVSWYQYFNGTSDRFKHGFPVANGILWVVVGLDRADSWSMATVPFQHSTSRNGVNPTVRFGYDEENPQLFWQDKLTYIPHYKSTRLTDGTYGAIFLRVIGVALSPSEWAKHVARIPSHGIKEYTVLSIPPPGLIPRIRRIWNGIKLNIWKDNPEPARLEGFFHPAVPLLHILLLTDDSATVGLVGDDVWSSEFSSHDLTHSEVVQLIRRIIENHDIANIDGLVTFTPKKHADTPAATSSSRRKKGILYIRYALPWSRKMEEPTVRDRALQNMCKVLFITQS